MGTLKWLGLACAVVSLTGCLDDSSDGPAVYQPPAAPDVAVAGTQTGFFIDSPVQNVDYRTATHQGVTGSDGSFQYELGETITLSLGDLILGSAKAQTVVTPLELLGTEIDLAELVGELANLSPEQLQAQQGVVNMARLLQSLDKDGNAGNGIVVTNQAKNGAAAGLVFNSDFASFASAANALVQNGGQDNAVGAVIDAEPARQHLASSLACGGDRDYVVNGYGVTVTRDLDDDSETLAVDAVSGSMVVGESRPAPDTVRNELRDCDLYVGADFRLDRDACEVVDGEPRNLANTDIRLVGTVAPNSATLYVYDGKSSADHSYTTLADLDEGTTAYDIPHGYLTAVADTHCAATPVAPGSYHLEGVLSVFKVGVGWQTEELSGDLVVSEDSCSIRSGAGIWGCQVVGNRVFGMDKGADIRGTINKNTVTLVIPYSEAGDDYRFGFLHGERNVTPLQ